MLGRWKSGWDTDGKRWGVKDTPAGALQGGLVVSENGNGDAGGRGELGGGNHERAGFFRAVRCCCASFLRRRAGPSCRPPVPSSTCRPQASFLMGKRLGEAAHFGPFGGFRCGGRSLVSPNCSFNAAISFLFCSTSRDRNSICLTASKTCLNIAKNGAGFLLVPANGSIGLLDAPVGGFHSLADNSHFSEARLYGFRPV